MDHAQYIASWLQALGNDHNFIFNSGAHISKAIEYLDELQPTQVTKAA
jgi:antirestriction protein ArdC